MDLHSLSSNVYINVSGLMYETRIETLTRYPDTLLGNPATRVQYYCSESNEYFFNRHRESFASVLFFYQSSGTLCRPRDINLKIFVEECEFFELPEWAVKLMKRKEGGFLEEEVYDLLTENKEVVAATCRSKIWKFLEEPSSSVCARRFALIYVFLLIVSIVLNCLKTEEKYVHHHDGMEFVDIIINGYFLVEFNVRFIVCPHKISFFKRLLVWIDFIALITYIPVIHKHYTEESMALPFTPFQVFRAVRIFRMAKLLPGYNATVAVLKCSLEDLKNFICCLLFVVIFSGVILYNLEHEEKDTAFISIPGSLYWAVQTFVTLGYGDMVPNTVWGKLFASYFILCFIPLLSVPALSIIMRFTAFYELLDIINK